MIKYNQSLKTKIASIVVVGLSLLPTTMAIAKDKTINHNPVSQQRTIELDVAHPFSTFDSRANLNYSANQIVAKGLDYLGNKSLDKNILGRIAKTAGEAYTAYLFSYITHEAGHDKKNTKFSSELRPGTLTPKIKSEIPSQMPNKKKSAYHSRGLNQNTFNSDKILENAVLNSEAPGLSFLTNSLYTSCYNTNNNTRTNGETTDDLIGYSETLKERGVETSKEKIQRGSRISDALTLENWKTAYDSLRFILTRKRADAPLTFKIKDTKFTPPAISCYLGETGNFYNATSFINPQNKNPISVSAGFEQDKARVGGKIYNIETPINNLTISPHAHINFENVTPSGYSAGTDLEYNVGKGLSLKFALEYNKKDLMSKIKETDGFDMRAGIKFKF